MEDQGYLTASDLAKEAGLTRQGIYYYEQKGLIEPVIKTETIRLYDKSTLERVRKIQQHKDTYKLSALKEKLDKGEL